MSINNVSDLPLDEKLRLARATRYACQSVARIALPSERVSRCLRQRFSVSDDIEVWKHQTTQKAFYTGLMVCGSVWVCPVCAAKISERRRLELKSAYDQHISSGGKVALLTLTFSHKKTDRLIDTLSRFSEATKDFRSGRSFQKVRDAMGLIGSIRAFEITYGSNGFHPHTHLALFYTNDIDLEVFENDMRQLWRKSCSKFGLATKDEYALTLEDGEKADEYMAKHGTWGVDRELTKSHIKVGKKDSLTPFDFLRKFLEDGEKRYLDLFAEYAQALKGKTQLYWSKGLKKRFVIEDKSDEELAKEKREEADLLGSIEYYVWKEIIKSDKRSTILDICEKQGFEHAMVYVKNNLLIKNYKKNTPIEGATNR